MKKIFTILTFCALFIGISAQTKIAYINATATAYPEDSVLKIIQAVPNTAVTILAAQGTAQPVSYYANYDIVVLAENVGSGVVEALALKDTLKKADKPYLNFKMFMMGKSAAPNTWKAMGGAANCPISNTANDTSIVVPLASQSHQLFTGITFPIDGKIQVIKTLGQDGWVTADVDPKERGMQAIVFNAGYTYADRGTVLARPESYKGVGFDTAFIHEITADKYLSIGIFGGPPTAGTSPKILPILTAEGYKIVGNAVEYMKTFITTGIPATKASSLSVIRSGNQFTIQFGKVVKSNVAVYSITGKLVAKKAVNADNTSIDLSNIAKGIYIIKANGLTQKVVVK